MSYQCTSLFTTKLDAPVADCAALAKLDQQLLAEAARSASMQDAELDEEVRKINDALNRSATIAQKAKDAFTQGSKKLAMDAVGATLDLALDICVTTGNPACIGSALGTQVLYGAVELSVQLYEAKTPAEQAEVAVAFGKKRAVMFTSFVKAMAPATPGQKAVRALRRMARVVITLQSDASTVFDAKADLDEAVEALTELNALYGPILVDRATYRAFRKADFESRRFLIGVLRSGFGGNGCVTTSATGLP